ncbi:MAG: hypothetical protein IPK89_10455 [Sphingomonadales bacterium]|nr:hypothetical protein [Sphingomonadales bacterium]
MNGKWAAVALSRLRFGSPLVPGKKIKQSRILALKARRKPSLTAYACADGTKAFTEQGIDQTTLYLIDDTTSHAERLSTPSPGMPYFGDGIEVRLLRGGLQIDRLKQSPVICKRL